MGPPSLPTSCGERHLEVPHRDITEPSLLIWVSREPVPPRQPSTSGGNWGFVKNCMFVPVPLWLAALTFPSREREIWKGKRECLLESLGLKKYQSEDMPLTSSLPGFQKLSHLMETGVFQNIPHLWRTQNPGISDLEGILEVDQFIPFPIPIL